MLPAHRMMGELPVQVVSVITVYMTDLPVVISPTYNYISCNTYIHVTYTGTYIHVTHTFIYIL